MRADDHCTIQPLYVMEMDKAGTPGVRFDNEGSGYGFRTVLALPPERTVPPTTCRMTRLQVERVERVSEPVPVCPMRRWFDQPWIRPRLRPESRL